jgi:hypothetical protein
MFQVAIPDPVFKQFEKRQTLFVCVKTKLRCEGEMVKYHPARATHGRDLHIRIPMLPIILSRT